MWLDLGKVSHELKNPKTQLYIPRHENSIINQQNYSEACVHGYSVVYSGTTQPRNAQNVYKISMAHFIERLVNSN